MRLRPLYSVFLAAMMGLGFAGALAAQSSLNISNIIRNGGTNTLIWSGADTNYAFTVQRADSLADLLWLNPTWTSPWPTMLNQWSDPTPPGSSCFYRVVKVPAAQRGALAASTSVTNLNYLTLVAIGFIYGITPQYAVNVYRLTYETIDPLGAKVTATGLLCLPQGKSSPSRIMSYQHGTVLQKSGAPSLNPTSTEGMVGIMMASLGYAAVMPDYVGLGGGTGFHPFIHAVSEATSAIDLLRAARTYCSSHSVALTNKVYLMGYSQGGHATMALHREIERYHQAEFSLVACAPMAGPYDVSGVTTDDFLTERVVPNPYYFAYVLAAYQSIYHLGSSLSNLLAAPYDSSLPPLLDGYHSDSEVNAAMANPPIHILKPELLAAFRSNPHHPLRQALMDNDVCNWKPSAPMRLWHCSGDLDVVFANSVTATNRFRQQGVAVQLIDPSPTSGHSDCALPSLQGAKTWFQSFP